jgi:hypothetical protein
MRLRVLARGTKGTKSAKVFKEKAKFICFS